MQINEYLNFDQVKSILPQDVMFRWTSKSVDPERSVYMLHALQRSVGSTEAPLTGDVIVDARNDRDPNSGLPMVTMAMNPKGAQIWENMTDEAAQENPKGHIAIVLDQKVISAPSVNNKISGGNSQITGLDDELEAQDLANILRSGKLDARTIILEEAVVGPSLGKETIRRGLISLLIGFLLVIFFMIAYYGKGGIVSNIALLLNLFFILGVLASLNAALTLPGIAGIVLTVGMAVDANVIIFERIREELTKGKGPRLALVDGFKHSYSAIIDANVTTLLTGIILLFFGLGPVKGFATILVIGIVSSFFTAVYSFENGV